MQSDKLTQKEEADKASEAQDSIADTNTPTTNGHLTKQASLNIDKELTPQKFAAEQLLNIVIQFGSAAAGFFIGKALSNVPAIAKRNTAYRFGAFTPASTIGTAVGSVVGSMALGYKHWRKTESERLAVGEINKDVADIIASRTGFEETLEQQGQVVRELRERMESNRSDGNNSRLDTEIKRRDSAEQSVSPGR